MLKTKSFIVVGETLTRNGKPEKNIAEKIDKAINEYLAGLGDAKYVDLKTNVQIGTTNDNGFITIITDGPDKPKAVVDSEEPVIRKKKST